MDSRSIRDNLKPVKMLDIKFMEGGLGDSIARLPAIKYILDSYLHIEKIRIFAQDHFKELCEFALKEYANRIQVYGYSEEREQLIKNPSYAATVTYHTKDLVQHTTLRTHLTHHAFHTLVNEVPLHPSAYNYLKLDIDKLPSSKLIFNALDYAVITTGFTAAVREFLPSEINKVAQWFTLKGITPVFLGKTQNTFDASSQRTTNATFRPEIDLSLGINLIDQTTHLEAAKIIAGAKVIVGVDNGLLHLAGMTDIPIVGGYTTVNPWHRMPIRNSQIGWNCRAVVPEGCNFCQTKANFLFGFDFRNCYYGDYKCVSELTAKKFIRELEFVCH